MLRMAVLCFACQYPRDMIHGPFKLDSQKSDQAGNADRNPAPQPLISILMGDPIPWRCVWRALVLGNDMCSFGGIIVRVL